jgi:hypothetical protein
VHRKEPFGAAISVSGETVVDNRPMMSPTVVQLLAGGRGTDVAVHLFSTKTYRQSSALVVNNACLFRSLK